MLQSKTSKLVDEAKELMGLCIKQMDYRDLKNMYLEEFYAMEKCLEFVDSACELMVEEAELMDDLNYKLDKVLALLNKEES